MNLTDNIIEHVMTLSEGTPISARELLHLGSRAAIDQALSRLATRGRLLRVGRGLYVRPIATHFGIRPPSVEEVVAAMAATRGEIITPHGAVAANALGLMTQVPLRAIYLTSGPSRKLTIGAQTIEFRCVPTTKLVLAGSLAGDVIRALEWLGRERAKEALPALVKQLPAFVFDAICSVRSQLPTWLAAEVSRIRRSVPWSGFSSHGAIGRGGW